MILSLVVILPVFVGLGRGLNLPIFNLFAGDATQLVYNDLNVSTASSHEGVLLLDSQLNLLAESACESLHEKLLPTTSSVFGGDLVHLLQYQVYQGHVPKGQQFWIASKGSTCQVVDTNGHISSSSCLKILPALCTQSSPANAVPSSQNALTVSSQGLTITGYRDQRAFRFLGIPYANPPARWTYPQPYTGSRTIDATKFGSQCVQAGNNATSEDCLFLNIITPFVPRSVTSPKSALKPVMFWIHGGAFTGGTGSDSTFEGGNLASRGDVVLVTTNYRLSTLGFLALNDGKTNGNYGIADIIAALEWVNTHISAFGGDPSRITIFGQSAGAAAVRALLASPKAIGKYAAAIQMSNLAGSGYATTYSNYYTIEQEATTVAQPILAAVGCNNAKDALSCLKKVDGNTLVNVAGAARYIVVDGTYVQHPELPLDGSAKVANVHAMIGFMRDDGAAFISTPKSSDVATDLSAAGLPTTMANSSLFPLPDGPQPLENIFNLTARGATDSMFRCLDQATAFSAINHNLFKSVWFYEFNRSYQTPGFDPNAPRCDAPVDADHPHGNPANEYFKCHSGELYYVFGSLPTSLPYRDANDLPFMQMSLDTWASFARTYNPNPDPAFLAARGYTESAQSFAKQSKWDAVTRQNVNTSPLRELQYPSFMTNFKEQPQCDFFGYPLNHYG